MHQSFGSRELGQEQLHFVGRSFLGQEVKNNAMAVSAAFRSTPASAARRPIHSSMCPRQPHSRRVPAIMYIRTRHDKREFGKTLHSLPAVEMTFAAHYKIFRSASAPAPESVLSAFATEKM